jgi:small subunit ribosomal protein S1
VSDPEEDFATLFAASVKAKQYDRGQTIEGRIVGIGPAVAFVDVGGKGEAQIDVAELKDADGRLEVKVGDRIRATVISTAGTLTLSRKLGRKAAGDRQLHDAFAAELPVEGKVERVIKGGYEVRVGGARAFCPLSQIDIARTADPETHVGRVYTFRIVEYKDDGRNLVVSRRALLEAEQEARAAEVRAAIVPGAIVTGRVVSVREYGAFIDLGGNVQGLLHVSDIGWARVSSASELLAPGDTITVKVLRVDEATDKIALGLKQLTDDPWSRVGESFAVGQVRSGRVTRVAEFGAFVELEPGIEGLAHASTFPPTGHRGGWKASVPIGMTAPFEILGIDPAQKRISLARVDEGSTRAAGAASSDGAIVAGARLTGKIERHEKFGVFVFLAPGRTALMPSSETGLTRDADIVKAFPVGADVEVVVLEADPAGRRIRVSHKAVIDAQDAEELREYSERSDAAPAEGFGSLADKLRSAIDPRRK